MSHKTIKIFSSNSTQTSKDFFVEVIRETDDVLIANPVNIPDKDRLNKDSYIRIRVDTSENNICFLRKTAKNKRESVKKDISKIRGNPFDKIMSFEVSGDLYPMT